MIALHGIWNSSEFHLWGEDSLLLTAKKKSAGIVLKKRPPTHSFALGQKALRQAVKELAGDLPDCKDSEIHLTLPSGSLRPLTSPELLYSEERSHADQKALNSRKSHLTEERDKSIARAIAETLKPGEIAVLFIWAYHNVNRYLPDDIVVEQLKDQDKVRFTSQNLLTVKQEKTLNG